ncbi:hypothetical protein SLA2020_509750 [Shorea laevis]
MEEVYLYGGHSSSEQAENMDMVTSSDYSTTFPIPAAGLEEIAFGSCAPDIPDADWMEVSGAVRAKIASHSLYPKLLQAYIDCQKVGAPPEVAKRLDEIGGENDTHDVRKRSTAVPSPSFGVDPELDHFMETYCDILRKFKSDLSRPFDEAMLFLESMRTQLSHLCHGGASETYTSEEAVAAAASSEEDLSGGELESFQINQDSQLKEKLLQKYRGYISNLKHEFSKSNKKRGRLPKESTQILLNWWNVNYRWPYPTESEKAVLTVSTGLDPKQINNWFINQRKRHWNPPEKMQIDVVEGLYGPFINEE